MGSTWPNLAPTRPNLAPSWAPWNPPNHQKPMVFIGFCYFNVFSFKTSKQASRRPQEAPKRLQEGPKSLQEGPQRRLDDPKGGPGGESRRAQDGPKTAPRRFYFACQHELITKMLPRYVKDAPRSPKTTPRVPQKSPRGPREPPRGPQEPPEGPQEASKTVS